MKDVLQKAADYQRIYAIVGRAHYLAGDRLANRNRWLGVPVIIITAVIGTTIFATIDRNPDPKWKVSAGLISLTGVVLSALQTSLGFAQTSERHKAVATRYRAIKRRLDLFILRYTDAGAEQRTAAIAELDALNQRLTDLAAECPSLPDNCYDRAVAEYDRERMKP